MFIKNICSDILVSHFIKKIQNIPDEYLLKYSLDNGKDLYLINEKKYKKLHPAENLHYYVQKDNNVKEIVSEMIKDKYFRDLICSNFHNVLQKNYGLSDDIEIADTFRIRGNQPYILNNFGIEKGRVDNSKIENIIYNGLKKRNKNIKF